MPYLKDGAQMLEAVRFVNIDRRHYATIPARERSFKTILFRFVLQDRKNA
jgi:hypothetical protein